MQKPISQLEWYQSNFPKHNSSLEIIHFNDVYNLEPRQSGEIKAGASRFITALNTYNPKNEKLVLFSGDLFFPSYLSSFYNGEQMVFPFNKMNVDISCLGNHEVDYGLELAEKLLMKTNCPWLMTNLVDTNKNNRPIAGCEEYKIIEHKNLRIGFLGFADEDWIGTLNPSIELDKLKYIDFNESLQKYSKFLKNNEKCDLIIALNHMRSPDDRKMARDNKCPEVLDMIFGGHDHSYFSELNKETDVYIQKSGTDFEVFTNLTVLFGVQKYDFEIFKEMIETSKFNQDKNVSVEYSVNSSRMYICEKVFITDQFEENEEIENHILSFTKEINKILDLPAVYTKTQIEARFSRIRSQETNLGNFIADLIRTEFQTDFSINQGGGLRANCVYQQGILQNRFLSEILPQNDYVYCMQVPGKIMKELLENGISQWPKYDGRWPCISGLRFKFDPSRPAGDRIIENSLVTIKNEKIEMDKYYKLASSWFIQTGGDGYVGFLDPSVKRPESTDPPLLQDIVKNFFQMCQKTNQEIENMTDKNKEIFFERLGIFNTREDLRDEEYGFIQICPQLDGRIQNVGSQQIQYND